MGRIVRELQTSTEQETWQGSGWGLRNRVYFAHLPVPHAFGLVRPSKGFERQVTLRQNVATICY